VAPRAWAEGGSAARAAEFGWGPLDLFGCDREAPFARVDRLGMLWLLNGGNVVPKHGVHIAVRFSRPVNCCGSPP